MNKKAFSLVEVMFATAIMCLLFLALTSQFVSSKKTHYKSSEYLNKVYLAETVLKLLKDQVHINPNFFININNAYIKKSGEKDNYAYKVFIDEAFNDPIASKDFEFKISNVPVIRRVQDGGKPQSYYFGFFKIEDMSPANAGNDKTSTVLLNVKDIEKYFFDLEITNEKGVALEGMLKNITVTVKSNAQNDLPFTVSTKALCPPESLDSEIYTTFQRNLFVDSQEELQKKIGDILPKETLKKTLSGDEGYPQKIYNNILKLLKPTNNQGVPGLPFVPQALINDYYAPNANPAKQTPYYQKIGDSPHDIEKKVARLIEKVYFILYVIDFNRYIQTNVYDGRIEGILKTGSNSNLSTDDVKELINLYTSKAQLAVQTIDLIRPPFDELNAVLKGGTNETTSVMLACFLKFAKAYPVNEEKNIIDSFNDELPQIKDSFSSNGIQKALEKVNVLISNKLEELSSADLFKYTKQLIAFNQLNHIIAKVENKPPVYSADVDANIAKLKKKFAGDDYNAEIAYLATEEKKIKNIGTLIDDKYSVIRDKIRQFDAAQAQFDILKSTTETTVSLLQLGIAGSVENLITGSALKEQLDYAKMITVAGQFQSSDQVNKDIQSRFGVSANEFNDFLKSWNKDNSRKIPSRDDVKKWVDEKNKKKKFKFF